MTGSGGASGKNTSESADIARERASSGWVPTWCRVPCPPPPPPVLPTPFKIKVSTTPSAPPVRPLPTASVTPTELIQLGKRDIIFAGGGEELDWSSTIQFDAMGALSTKYNDNPEKASRTYDADRDGFIISGGGGILVVEELEHALARGAHLRRNHRLRCDLPTATTWWPRVVKAPCVA